MTLYGLDVGQYVSLIRRALEGQKWCSVQMKIYEKTDGLGLVVCRDRQNRDLGRVSEVEMTIGAIEMMQMELEWRM